MEDENAKPSRQASVDQDRSLATSSSELLFGLDGEGAFSRGQLDWQAFTGQSPDQWRGLGWMDVIHPEERETVAHEVKAALKALVPYRRECRVRRGDGASRWIRLYITPVRDDGASCTQWMGMLVDFTEHVLSQDALQQSDQRMRLATQATGVGIWEWNVFTNLVRWDKQMFRLYGLEPTASGIVTYETWRNAVLPDEVALQEQLMGTVLLSGGTGYREFQIRRADDGCLRCVRAVETVRRNEAGEIEWVVGTNLDVTDSKRAEEALREKQALLREIIDTIPEPIYLKDREGRLILVNNALCQTIGLTREQCLGKTDEEFLEDKEAGRKIMETDRRIMETGRPETVEEAIASSQGLRCYLSSKTPFRDPAGHVIGLLGNSRDITDRKLQEDQVRFLLREVNHRSKNLLTLIQSMARQTSQRHADEFLPHFERRLQALAANQDVLVKNDWRSVPLGDLVRSQLSHFGDQLDTRISIEGPPVSITPSASQALAMALHELATNASKYGALSEKRGRVDIGWVLRSAEHNVQIFTMTWTERDGPSVRKPERQGFGSTVVDRMLRYALAFEVKIDFHRDGLVWRIDGPADRILDSQSTLANTLSPVQNLQARQTSQAQISSKRRVLVVEDDPMVADEIAFILSTEGFSVVGPSRSVSDAILLIERTGCDAAVLDTNLGTETAVPVAAKLRSIGIPFISVSGYSRDQQPVALRNVPLLTKPLKREKFVEAVCRCFEPRSEPQPRSPS